MPKFTGEAGAALIFLIGYTLLFAWMLFAYVTHRMKWRSPFALLFFHVTVRVASQSCGIAFGILGFENTNVFLAYLILGAEGYFSLEVLVYMSDDPDGRAPLDPTQLAAISGLVVNTVALAAMSYSSQYIAKEPYHTSDLTGYGWVKELIEGHPRRIRNELGISLHVFLALVQTLREFGCIEDSRKVSVEEQVAIFLYMCVTGLSIRHIGERFQLANATVSKYFKSVLDALVSPAFYNKYVQLPSVTSSTPAFIKNNPHLSPFFDGALGAIDGTHLACCPPAEDVDLARDRKGGLSQNCLAAVTWTLLFIYVVSGWDGACADAEMYHRARLTDFFIPAGRYYLADAGFGSCEGLLVPFRNVRYHLKEWGLAKARPTNAKELYNLRHSAARNVVERIFGIIKRRWAILVKPPEFSMDIQSKILPALAALHNFIRIHDPDEIENFKNVDSDPQPAVSHREADFGILRNQRTSRREKQIAEGKREQISRDMWSQFVDEHRVER